MKTDNDNIQQKKQLRKEVYDKVKNPKILECFAGAGKLWQGIAREDELISIEMEPGKYPKAHLQGDSLKFMKSMDLNKYNIIDLDAYGIPFNHLEQMFKTDFSGYVIVTAIQSGMGQMPYKMLNRLGFTNEMIKKAPVFFSRNGLEKLKNYLSLMGITEITGYFISRKNYFYFKQTTNK